MDYSISLEDIRGYLATVPEGEEVGIPQHRQECLVASTLRWKYPGKSVSVWFDNAFAQVSTERVDLPPSVYAVANTFDDLWGDDLDLSVKSTYGSPVTVSALRELMPEIWETQEVSNA